VRVTFGPSAAELTWEPGSADDVVYVEIASDGAAAQRCQFGDSGHATLATTLLPGDQGLLTLHRVHREAFRAKGLDSGEIRFDFAKMIAYSRR
jgi:hypothetical protein